MLLRQFFLSRGGGATVPGDVHHLFDRAGSVPIRRFCEPIARCWMSLPGCFLFQSRSPFLLNALRVNARTSPGPNLVSRRSSQTAALYDADVYVVRRVGVVSSFGSSYSIGLRYRSLNRHYKIRPLATAPGIAATPIGSNQDALELSNQRPRRKYSCTHFTLRRPLTVGAKSCDEGA